MKLFKTLLLSILLITGYQIQPVSAQLGKLKVKKPKVSVPKIKSKKTSSTSSNSSSTSTSTSSTSSKAKSDKPEYDPNDPTYRAYSMVRDGISSAKSTINGTEWNRNREGSNESISKDFKKITENLDKLKAAGEDSKDYYKTFESDYKELEEKRKSSMESYNLDVAYDNKLDAYYKWAAMGWEIQDKEIKPSYSGYNSFRKDFETNRPEKFKDSYVQKRVTAVDDFFKVKVYERLPGLEEDIDHIIKSAHKINGRGEEAYLLNAKSYLKDFEKPLESIKYKKEFLLEDKTEINRIEAKLLKEKSMLDEYVNSGKCDAHRAKYEQEIIDAVRVGKKAMTNAKYEGMATKGVDKGTPVRAVVTSSTWYVKKNDFGYPLYKSLGVDIVVKKEGKCYLAYGQIRKTYEGGGQYGGEFFNYWGIQEEMNCANINK